MVMEISAGRGSGRTEKFLSYLAGGSYLARLNEYGAEGVRALSAATPVDSRLTSMSWTYEIVRQRGGPTIVWRNTNEQDGVNVAILIQYGHGTGTGGWVEGRDFINPAIQPIFDKIATEVWRQVTNG